MDEIQARVDGWIPDENIDDLFRQINEGHDEVICRAGATVNKAFWVGDRLIEAKSMVPHGYWSPLVKAKCRFSIDTAQRYMKAAKNRTCAVFENGHPDALRQFFAMLSAPSEEEENESIEEPTLFMADGETDPIEEKEACDKQSESKAEQKTESKAESSPIPWTDSERERREQAEQGITVIANMSHDHQLIAWAQNERRFIKIDRTTPFGNPMKLDWMRNDRSAVVEWYLEHYLPFVIHNLPIEDFLNGKVLGCWCYPDQCHGNAIIDYLCRNLL